MRTDENKEPIPKEETNPMDDVQTVKEREEDERLTKNVDDFVDSMVLKDGVKRALQEFFNENKEEIIGALVFANLMTRVPYEPQKPIPKHLKTCIATSRRITQVYLYGDIDKTKTEEKDTGQSPPDQTP